MYARMAYTGIRGCLPVSKCPEFQKAFRFPLNIPEMRGVFRNFLIFHENKIKNLLKALPRPFSHVQFS